jgi:hypothetical protein
MALLNRLFVVLFCTSAADLVFSKSDKQIIIITALFAFHLFIPIFGESPQ